MREIKFRGKRIDNGEWVYGMLDCIYKEDGVTTISYVDNEGFYCEDKVDYETVGQFTGLVIDNQKIYEDDILFDEHCEEMYVVSFDEYRFIGSDNTIQYDLCELDYCVHIGNIHDNPELLEVKQ